MNAQLSTFSFEETPIRVLNKDGEPWFVAKDVCDVLELTNSRKAISALDEDEKGVTLTYTLGGQQEINIINESGLYILILRSRKAMRKGTPQYRFRKWVTSEVLPQIRKTGSYQKTTEPAIPYEPKRDEVGDDTLQTLFDFLFLAHAQAVVLKDLYPALVQMMSKLHTEVHSLWTETSFVFNLKRNSLGDTLLLLAQESPKWKETLRHFNSLNTIKKSEPQTTKLSFR